MQKLRCHSASTGVRARHFSMDHRIKSGGDESEIVAWHSSDAKSHRENEILLSPLPVGERACPRTRSGGRERKRAGEGVRMFRLRAPYPLTPTLSPTGKGRRRSDRASNHLRPTRAVRNAAAGVAIRSHCRGALPRRAQSCPPDDALPRT
jgi:hypothetical protein